MPIIKVLPHEDICPSGVEFEAQTGASICDNLLKNDVHIEHACEKVCACTTCHVIIREGIQSLAEASDQEEDMLDLAWGLTPQSRLSCQAIVGQADLTVELPKYTRNHAKEGH